MVSSTRSIRTAGSGRSTRNRVAPSSALAMMMPTPAPTAPVMKALRPSMIQSSPSRRAVVRIIDGSEPAPPSSAGSVMKKAERVLPRTSVSRNRSLWAGVATRPNRNMLPSSGAATLTAGGPKGDRPAARSTLAVSRCDRWRPSPRICGVRTPNASALARSSVTRASDGPCGPRRGSRS